jgi:hypothetical protein
MPFSKDLYFHNANCSNRKVAFEIPATRAKKCDFGEVPTDKFEDISKDHIANLIFKREILGAISEEGAE